MMEMIKTNAGNQLEIRLSGQVTQAPARGRQTLPGGAAGRDMSRGLCL